jgi:hypothetical protein
MVLPRPARAVFCRFTLGGADSFAAKLKAKLERKLSALEAA